MPIYEYECPECHTVQECLVRKPRGWQQPAPKCEKCQAQTQRKISRSAFSLKGGGWYADGYSKGTGKPS